MLDKKLDSGHKRRKSNDFRMIAKVPTSFRGRV